MFQVALTHEAIVSSSPSDPLLSTMLHTTVRVPFEHWRKLDIQLTHLWSSGQSQEIYKHSSDSDYAHSQQEVVELLSWWQQFACLEFKNVRMILSLYIDTEGVHVLPPRVKALSLQSGHTYLVSMSSLALTPVSPSVPHPTPDLETESDSTFNIIEYESPTGVNEQEDSSEVLVTNNHVEFDRSSKRWNRLVFHRIPSN